MGRSYYSVQEIREELRDVFCEEVAEITAAARMNDTHPASTVAAIEGIQRYIRSVEGRLAANEVCD